MRSGNSAAGCSVSSGRPVSRWAAVRMQRSPYTSLVRWSPMSLIIYCPRQQCCVHLSRPSRGKGASIVYLSAVRPLEERGLCVITCLWTYRDPAEPCPWLTVRGVQRPETRDQRWLDLRQHVSLLSLRSARSSFTCPRCFRRALLRPVTSRLSSCRR